MSLSARDEGVDNLFCVASTSNSFGQQTLARPKANTAALFAHSETSEEFVKAACLYLFLDFSMHASYSRFADICYVKRTTFARNLINPHFDLV